jgi:hypothetical protein
MKTTPDHALVRVEHTQPIQVHLPRPALATEANCRDVLGLEPRAFRALLRRLGVPTVPTSSGGRAAAVDDVLEALRRLGEPMPSSKAQPAEDAGADMLRQAGGRRGER